MSEKIKKGNIKKTIITENLLLAQRLKECRERVGLFQIDVAKELGVNSSVISNYEHAYRDPSTNTLNKLAKMYNVSADYLLGNTNVSTPYPYEQLDEERQVTTWFNESPETRIKSMRNFTSTLQRYVSKEKTTK